MTDRNPSRQIIAALLFAFLAVWPLPTKAEQTAPIRIVAFGDSLIAGYGLSLKDAFPEQLAAALKEKYPQLEILNAGVSGDTTTAALARLNWAFPDDVHGAIILLGGNDFLRGQSPRRMKQNLDTIMTKLKARKLEILLLGMLAPRNAGKAYFEPFDAAYPALAAKHDTLLEPFFLAGVAGQMAYNQIDGIHPNAKGVALIVKRILPKAEALIARIQAARKTGTTN